MTSAQLTVAQVMVTVATSSWKSGVARASKLFAGMTDEQLMEPVAPGRNRPIYLLGHLTAIHDRMHPLLGFGEPLHPELDEIFVTQPDRAVAALPSTVDLKTYWTDVNDALWQKIEALSPEEWVERHTAVSEEDFAKTPTRNRLSVLLSRTNHLSFHVGQIILAPK
jgi:hypothetical protein